jgi:hypothetical protein
MRRHRTSLLALLLALAFPRVTHAAWPVTGLPLCNVPEDLEVPVAYSYTTCFFLSGCGGFLTLYWQDARSAHGSIYTSGVSDAQPHDPPPVVPATLFLQRPGVQTPGGAVRVLTKQCTESQFCGGAFATMFAWTDAPDGAPSVVRVRRDGGSETEWGPDGFIVATSAGSQHDANLIDDLHGGAIVVWLDETPEHRQVFAQRLDSLGTGLWGDAGVFVGSDTTVQTRPQLAPDGAGGVYVLREDLRGGARTLALFRLAANGTLAGSWPATGVVLGTAPEETPAPLLRVGGSGAWVVWHETVTLADQLPALRPFTTLVDPTGQVSPVLTAAGTEVATGLEGDAIADDASASTNDDLVVTFEYTQRLPAPAASSTDLYAARLEAAGSRPAGWPATGLVVCDAPGVQRQGRVFRQGGGAFLAWTDERSGDGDIYSQRLLDSGLVPAEWPANGLLVCGVAGTQQDPVIAPNFTGGGFVVWRDGRDAITNGWDLYGQTVSGDARLDAPPVVPTRLALLAPRPNPARGPVRMTLELPASGRVCVDVLDVAGRRVHAEEFAATPGARDLTWDLASDAGPRVRPGLYLVRVRAMGEQRTARVLVTE